MRSIIDDFFKTYNIEYDPSIKRITIKRVVTVNEFMYIRKFISNMALRVNEINVEPPITKIY